MTGWSWSNTLTVVALVISSGALLVSIRTARHHPKPKIVVEWWDRFSSPVDDNPYTLGVSIWNHGDAPATDVRLRVDTIFEALPYDLQKIMFSEVQIKPGEAATHHLPMQPVKIGMDPYGVSDDRYTAIDPNSRPVRPTLVVQWRQQPFTRLKKLKSRAPAVPEELPLRRAVQSPEKPDPGPTRDY